MNRDEELTALKRELARIQELSHENEGVCSSLCIWSVLRYVGEGCGMNRVARLMLRERLHGIRQERHWLRRVRVNGLHLIDFPGITAVSFKDDWWICVPIN